MKNPLIKNCKTGIQDDILNRTSHYLKLLNSRSTVDNRPPKQYHSLHSLRNINEHKNNPMSLTSNNLKLMKSIINIDQKHSRYAISNNQQSHHQKTLRSQWKLKQKEQQLTHRNTNLYNKIHNIHSDLSLDRLTQFDKQMTKYSKIIRNPIRHITQMDQQFYNQFLQQSQRIKHNHSNLKHPQVIRQSSKIRNNKKKKLAKIKQNTSRLENQLILQQLTSYN